MKNITLSYVLTTYNKLDYLKVTLPMLIAACKSDEEIVVIDGGSTDGSADYLNENFKNNKIHFFLSESDSGEAHGTNKGILQAQGQIIKIITDDDLFDYTSIEVCKNYMLDHPHISVLGFDGYSCKLAEQTKFQKTHFIHEYQNWQKDRSPFLFCGLSLMIRKSAISHLGLFNVNYKIIDMEYTLRISSMNCKIAFYTAPAFINLVNPASNSVKFYDAIRKEYRQLKRAYPEAKLNFRINNPILKMKERLHAVLVKLKPIDPPNSKELLAHYNDLLKKGLLLFEKNRKSVHEILE